MQIAHIYDPVFVSSFLKMAKSSVFRQFFPIPVHASKQDTMYVLPPFYRQSCFNSRTYKRCD